MNPPEAIGVVGVGWVGLVTAACFAEQGHEVWAMDIDEEKIASLAAGEVTIHEPGLPELVRGNSERLHFTTSMDEALAGARLLFCCVDTPPTYSGDADLSRVQAVVDRLDEDSEHALVMKSTVPAGTGESIRRQAPGLAYVSCPEFLKEGSAVSDFLEPDRVVIGADPGDEWAADAIAAIYAPLGGEIVRTDVASAEMIKLASNAFLATKISFINEIANVCEEVGADVTEVARGMGLDQRIGPSFLRAGIGYGGSCLVGEETVLIKNGLQVGLRRLDELFAAVAVRQNAPVATQLLHPDELAVLSPTAGPAPEFRRVAALTRRDYDGKVVEVRTKMGRRLVATADHPFVVVDPETGERTAKLAHELTDSDWIPLARGNPGDIRSRAGFNVPAAAYAAGMRADEVILRLGSEGRESMAGVTLAERQATLGDHPRGQAQRWQDIRRSGALRLDEAVGLRLPLRGAEAGTARNGTYVPFDLELREDFWRVAGLYLAEGHCTVDGAHRRHRLQWSFHPRDEEDLVEFVAGFWRQVGVKATVRTFETTRAVIVSSKLLARWWLDHLRVGTGAYDHRIPDLAFSQPTEHRRALMGGMWRGDGSWSLVNGGPSVVLEYGTVSRELADGLQRMLLIEGLVASQRIGRTPKSTVDTYWLRLSGAEQVERASEFLVSSEARLAIREALSGLKKRIASTGFRELPDGSVAVRVVSTDTRHYSGNVYSMEVPGAESFVTTAGLVTHNCFPKDVSALKQLAGNTGYHFQLLNSVIEVNELQKRRVLGKLTKHLGSLVGKRIALLGLAFKPQTDDMREASSLVLAARLQGEGAEVVAFDPVAGEAATPLLPSVELAASAEDALGEADAAILVTEWPEFAELDWAAAAGRMKTPLVVDGRNFLDPAAIRAAGMVYEGIGRGNGVD
jgi:UDPglucose 6-dehydrogenase